MKFWENGRKSAMKIKFILEHTRLYYISYALLKTKKVDLDQSSYYNTQS